MNPILWLISTVLGLLSMVVFVWVILSLLITFNVVNRYHPIVGKIYEILEAIIEPCLRPIRRYMPNINGIDLSPLALIILIQFLQYSIAYYSTPSITYQ